MNGLLGQFLKVKEVVVSIRVQVLHLGVLHLEVPGLVELVENLALVKIFFKFGGCLLLLSNVNLLLISLILGSVPDSRRVLVLAKRLGLLGL